MNPPLPGPPDETGSDLSTRGLPDWLCWTRLLSPSALRDSGSEAAPSLTCPPADLWPTDCFLSGARPSLDAPSGVGASVAMQGSERLLVSCW